MSTWAIEERVGAAWQNDGTIPRPNDPMDEPVRSNQVKKKLIDGSIAVIAPPTKYEDLNIRMVFLAQPRSMKTKLEDYVKNNTGVRITTHMSKNLEGYFISSVPVQVLGIDEEYDITVEFLQISVP